MPKSKHVKSRQVRVTAERLREMGACGDAVKCVEREWPRGVPVTVQSIAKAFRLGLDSDVDVEWFARRTLTDSALAEYGKVKDSAWAEYQKVMALVWAEHEKVMASAWAEHEKVRVPARAEYEKAKAPALAPRLRAALRT